MVAERIAVDHEALLAAAGLVDELAVAVETRRTDLLDPLVAAEGHLQGADVAGQLRALSDAVMDVHGDLATALSGLAQGLESVSARFTEVDVVGAAEARSWWLGG